VQNFYNYPEEIQMKAVIHGQWIHAEEPFYQVLLLIQLAVQLMA
jgi:hypothetical protein